MAYQSLYRKYRPQTFADVMGQGHVVRTLQNALASGRIAHGYLFTGTRGTAKTTIARLLAKALNCQSTDHPVAEPCNLCNACKSITSGSSIDVIEMDAASHRGVADIEEVRKAVGYGPMELRYKVFIIDEAHQLSSDAKDAFLKTLEEPPANVVFILATTEPQAIPITIRSRCQQFDFKRGSLTEIASRLKFVLDCEGVTYTPDAINLVARGAEGSYRDSLSLLEQVLAYTPQHITANDVNTVLGSLDAEMLGKVIDAIAQRDTPTVFALAGELLNAGKEARTLLRTLSAHFRDLMLVSVGGPAVAAELTPEEVGRLQQQARLFTPPQMMRAMDILNETQGETRWNNQHRLLVELAFLKLMTLGDAPNVPLMTAPIVFSTTPAVTHTPATVTVPPVQPPILPPPIPTPVPKMPEVVAVPVVEPVVVVVEPVVEEELSPTYFADSDAPDDEDDYVPAVTDETDEEEADEVVTPSPGVTVETTPVLDTGPSLFDDPIDTNDGLDLFSEPIVATPAAVTVPVSTPSPTIEAEPETEEDEEPELVPVPTLLDVPVVTPVPIPVAVVAEPEPEEEEPVPTYTLDDVYRAWPRFLNEAQKISKRTETLMVTARPDSVERGVIEIVFSNRPSYEQMNQPKQQEFVRLLLAKCLGVELARVRTRFVLADTAPPPPEKSSQKKTVHRDPLAAIALLDPSVPSVNRESSNDYNFDAGSLRRNDHNNHSNGDRPTPPSGHHAPPPTRPAANSWAVAPPPASRTERAPFLTAPGNDSSAHQVKALADPLVQETLSVFGGEIIDD